MRANVWRVGRTAEDRLMYGRFIKAATSGKIHQGSNVREDSSRQGMDKRKRVYWCLHSRGHSNKGTDQNRYQKCWTN